MGLHPAPDIQDDLHQPGVVPPGGHGVHQLGKVAARHDVLIAPLQHVVEGPEHEDARLPLVAQAEVRIQVQQVAALPQQLGAKGVDRGDLCLVNQSRLTAQMGVGGVLRQPGGQLLHDAAPQLGGGGLGVGDHQEAVDVQPLPRHPGQEPLHQHPGLARPGRGGHQQSAAPVVYRGLLFGCQGECHGRCSFLVSCKTICRGGYHPPAWWRPGLPAGACPAGAPISSRRNGEKEGPGGFARPGPPSTGAHGGGRMYGQGKDRAGIAARFVGTSCGSLASPQAAKLVPSTVPLLPSRHCDSRAKLARQSRRSFFPARFIRHWRRFAGKLSPPNPLRWASAGAPCSFTSQALPRLGRHASGLPCKLWE